MKNSKIRKSKEITKSIITGLKESLKHSVGKKTVLRTREVYIPPVSEFKGKEIKIIRTYINLTQKLFARALGVSVKTVEAWEANRNIPDGPAQRILFALKNNPKALKVFNINIR
jgi:putative transcriptional regulator